MAQKRGANTCNELQESGTKRRDREKEENGK
jgi:hypothetical protein